MRERKEDRVGGDGGGQRQRQKGTERGEGRGREGMSEREEEKNTMSIFKDPCVIVIKRKPVY